MTRFLLPLGLFIGLVALLAFGLSRDPRTVPSPLVGRPAPEFTAPDLERPGRTVSSADLRGRVTLLNVWATWCRSCREEHPVLVDIARTGAVPIYGLNWKDDGPAALRWLSELGNPYVASAVDPDGRIAIDWGVYGAPETYLIDADGHIAYKHIGPITPAIWRDTLLPRVLELSGAGG